MTHEEYSDSLRQIADFFEHHPEIRLPNDAENFIYYGASNKEQLSSLARALGDCQKFLDTRWELFELRHKFGAITFRSISRQDAVCIRRVVGERNVPERTIPETIIPAHTEEVREWDCSESLLDGHKAS